MQPCLCKFESLPTAVQLLTLTALQHQLPAAAQALGFLTVVVPLPGLLAHWLVSAVGALAGECLQHSRWQVVLAHRLAKCFAT